MEKHPLDDFLAATQPVAADAHPLDAFLAATEPKKRTQAEWEASPEYARLKAKHDATVAKAAAINAEPDPMSLGEMAKNIVPTMGALANKFNNGATLGGWDALAKKVAPEQYAQSQEDAQRLNSGPGQFAAGLMTGTGGSMGAPAAIYSKIAAPIAQSIANPLLQAAVRGGTAGALTGGSQAALEGKGLGEQAKAAGIGAAVGGGLDVGGTAVGKLIGGAPKRAENSEIKALTEGVQYKTRVRTFEPNEAEIRSALNSEPQIRAAIKDNPEVASELVEQKLSNVADGQLGQFYRQMATSGKDRVPAELVINNLKAARGSYHPIAEEGQTAVIDRLIDKFGEEAAKNNGTLPAQFIREAATSFQGQGFANVPMFGQVPLTKQVKQDIGNALRSAITEHVESLAPGETGKALSDAFTSANKDVATWYRIRDIVDEKARRVAANAAPMGDIVNAIGGLVKKPVHTLIGVAPKAASIVDRKVLAPIGRTAAGQEFAQSAAGIPQAIGASGALNPLVEAARKQKLRDLEIARMLRGGAVPND